MRQFAFYFVAFDLFSIIRLRLKYLILALGTFHIQCAGVHTKKIPHAYELLSIFGNFHRPKNGRASLFTAEDHLKLHVEQCSTLKLNQTNKYLKD